MVASVLLKLVVFIVRINEAERFSIRESDFDFLHSLQ